MNTPLRTVGSISAGGEPYELIGVRCAPEDDNPNVFRNRPEDCTLTDPEP